MIASVQAVPDILSSQVIFLSDAGAIQHIGQLGGGPGSGPEGPRTALPSSDPDAGTPGDARLAQAGQLKTAPARSQYSTAMLPEWWWLAGTGKPLGLRGVGCRGGK